MNTLLSLTCLLGTLATGDAATPVATRLDVGDSSKVVRPGDEDQAVVVVRNDGEDTVRGTFHVQVKTFEDNVYKKSEPLTLPAGDERRVEMPTGTFDRLGIKWVQSRWEQDGRTSEPAEAAFAYMRPTGPKQRGADGFIFAIAYGAGPDNMSEEAARRSSLCGVNVARANPVWPSVQPREGVWDWTRPERILASHGRHGIEIQWLISYSPHWCRVDRDIHTPRDAPWREFCHRLATRYGDRVELYEIWNEPDIGFFNGTIEDYLRMLPIAYDAIHAADPTARVTTGGFASLDHHERKEGMAERVIEECQGSYDLIANHKHGHFGNFVEEFEHRLLPLCARVLEKPKPFYLTETGMDTRLGQHYQARTLPKKIVYAWANGAVGYTWFNLHDMARAEHDRQPGFTYGLFTRLSRKEGAKGWAPEVMDYENTWPKAAYVAYNTLTGALAGTRFVERMPLEDREHYVYLFSAADRHVVVAWNEDPYDAAPHLVLRTDAESVASVDIMGNREPLDAPGDRVLLKLTEDPAYWVFRGGEAPKLDGILAAPADCFVAVPGRPLGLSVEVFNPLPQAVTLETKWTLHERLQPAGSSGAKAEASRAAEESVRLEPGERRAVTIEVATASGRPMRYGTSMPCRFAYRVEPIGWSGELRVPVRMGAVRVPEGELPKHPLLRLHEVDQVVNLSEHDPHTAHLLWKGRDDLYAELRAARTAEGLQLQVTVRDNAHDPSNGDPWTTGDSLEILLHVPGADDVRRVRIAGGAGEPLVADGVSGSSIRRWGEPPWRHYQVTLSNDDFGFTEAVLADGVRLNLRIHDHDGQGQKGWLELAPGTSAESAQGWPLLLFTTNDGDH